MIISTFVAEKNVCVNIYTSGTRLKATVLTHMLALQIPVPAENFLSPW